MIQSRHWFVRAPVKVAPALNSFLQRAVTFENSGNWFSAAEAYGLLRDVLDAAPTLRDPIMNARVSARAASCFEIAFHYKMAARHYDRAAKEVADARGDPLLSGELFNRAARQFDLGCETLAAGSTWVRAAEEFDKIPASIVDCTDDAPPLPTSAFKAHLCGICLEAGAAAYEKGIGAFSVMAYWRAGSAYRAGIPAIQVFNAYRSALRAHIRYFGTLDVLQMRRSLPLSEADREYGSDPLLVMEWALANSYGPQFPHDPAQARLKTDQQIAATFHEFSLQLQSAGNVREAGQFRAAQNERQRRVLFFQRRYGSAVLYWLWKFTSDYGESLGRWASMCFCVLLLFGLGYDIFGVVGSGNVSDKSLGVIDYFYFSVVTFSTLGYGDLHPIGMLGKSLACLEVFLGLGMFGVLLSFIGSRFQRS